MKFAKLSIAALAVVGFSSSAVAFDLSGVTAKPFIHTKLYYEATDMNGHDMFDKKAASGDALLSAGVTGSLDSCWGYGLEYMTVDTLGLENNLVSNTRMGWGRESANELASGGGVVPAITKNQHWVPQAYVTYSPCNTILSNTTFKIGRQYLDTPLAFTERWNVAPNSFDAIAVINQDIKNVTLVGAYVGRGNGAKIRVTNGDRFEGYPGGKVLGSHATYAVGAMTNLIPGLPINAWYYDINSIAKAAWVDGGYTLKLADDMNVGLGAQYGQITDVVGGAADTSGFGVKLGSKIGIFNVMAAYTKMDDDGAVALANTATMAKSDGTGTFGGKKTKLYTAGIYTDGTGVAIPGSEAYKVKAGANFDGIGKVIAQYVHCENDVGANATAFTNVDEADLILATSIQGIGVKAIYMNRSVDDAYKKADKGLNDDTNHFRVILTKNF